MTLNARRVVVTGVGPVSSIGIGVQPFWEAALAGKSAGRPISAFDTANYPTTIAAEIADWRPADYLTPREERSMDRFTQFAVAAAGLALQDAGLKPEEAAPYRTGVMMGSGAGGMLLHEGVLLHMYANGPRGVSPSSVPQTSLNAAPGQIAIRYGFKGPNMAVSTACSSGNNAIGLAFDQIAFGRADVMIAGGCEAPITPALTAAFCSLRVMSRRNDAPASASRPFDKHRDGFVMGEGAAALVLESLEHAQRRKARIYAEILGYASTAEAHHMVIPAAGGIEAIETMKLALAAAKVEPSRIDYISAHGTSTGANDAAEAEAIRAVFGNSTDRIPVSALKSMIGHTLGAAGALEAVASIMTLHTGWVHPTINFETADEACAIDVVPNKARQHKAEVVLSNSFGFGGSNTAVVFGSAELI